MRPLEKIDAGDSGGRALPGTPPSGEDTEDTPDALRRDVDTRPRTPLTLLRPLAALPSLCTTGTAQRRADSTGDGDRYNTLQVVAFRFEATALC